MNSRNEGIIGIDHDAKPCPICGAPPRIHLHTFAYAGARGKVVRIRKSYYDCAGCGGKVTDWYEDPVVKDDFGRIVYGNKYAARDAWNNGDFLNARCDAVGD